MKRIAIMNMKGGSGKSTIATNLAAYCAFQGLKTSLIDFDPQESSLHWLKKRKEEMASINGISACDRSKKMTTSWQLHSPKGTDVTILDTPAGYDQLKLKLYIEHCDIILIPVMPSEIDMHAAAHFIEKLLITGRVLQKGKKIGVIANRVGSTTLSYRRLKKFLKCLNIPLVNTFRDTQNYNHASLEGLGVHELSTKYQTIKDIDQWNLLVNWLDLPSNPDKKTF